MRATPEIDICRAYLKVRHLTKPPAAGNQLSKAEATAQMGEDPFVKHQLLEPEMHQHCAVAHDGGICFAACVNWGFQRAPCCLIPSACIGNWRSMHRLIVPRWIVSCDTVPLCEKFSSFS